MIANLCLGLFMTYVVDPFILLMILAGGKWTYRRLQ